jgi:hypothetical protein
LQQDENFAMAANIGVFHGQTGESVSVIYRLAGHLAVSGGLATTFNTGTAGRLGFRVGW